LQLSDICLLFSKHSFANSSLYPDKQSVRIGEKALVAGLGPDERVGDFELDLAVNLSGVDHCRT
jgi:hypothetical protein